ncbi:hypothetical protein [Cupriavidus lacunae]|uniref:hypothetical protein n=1 Tax=Cupriavidus lacunae TaxID=2666307 RepID=UPI000E114BA5|nr:hypothetical protein [Cupriavidus lacunae]
MPSPVPSPSTSAKEIADAGGDVLLAHANLQPDNGIVPDSDTAGFIAAAKTRQWGRKPLVRMLP